jgi:hypothetical protein
MELVDGMQASLAAPPPASAVAVCACRQSLTFSRVCFRARLSADWRPAGDAASGLPLAPSRPLCHADISLENLMLTTAGGVKPYRLWRGWRRSFLPRPTGEDHSLTALHQVAGKPTYTRRLAADRAAAAHRTVQSDLYAAGVCAWELLTGQRFLVPNPGAPGARAGEPDRFAAAEAAGLPAAGWQVAAAAALPVGGPDGAPLYCGPGAQSGQRRHRKPKGAGALVQ